MVEYISCHDTELCVRLVENWQQEGSDSEKTSKHIIERHIGGNDKVVEQS